MITLKTMHKTAQFLQLIMSGINMAEDEEDREKRNAHLAKAKENIRACTDFLNSSLNRKPGE
jgi:hypothetical protein